MCGGYVVWKTDVGTGGLRVHGKRHGKHGSGHGKAWEGNCWSMKDESVQKWVHGKNGRNGKGQVEGFGFFCVLAWDVLKRRVWGVYVAWKANIKVRRLRVHGKKHGKHGSGHGKAWEVDCWYRRAGGVQKWVHGKNGRNGKGHVKGFGVFVPWPRRDV